MAVLAVTLIVAVIGSALVVRVVQSVPLQQAATVSVLAHRALQAGENAYVTALNANPSLAHCNTSTNGSGICDGIDYGQWNVVSGTDTAGDASPEYYAFGNPQPSFDPTSNELDHITVTVVGAAHDPSVPNSYVFDSETIDLAPKNGFLTNVWWSNYESYSATGNYATCDYNWKLGYNAARSDPCGVPVYFAPNDYVFGPVYTNDSVFVAGSGGLTTGPSFGNPAANVATAVHTADPHCLFVDAANGMGGTSSTCASATSDVHLYDVAGSTFGDPVQPPPKDDRQLATIAAQHGCLYSGPTQITLSTDASGVGQMTVSSPETQEASVNVNGTTVTWDTNNIATNYTNCPNNGTAPLPPNGVVFVQDASASQVVTGANPFDNAISNTVTNVTASPASPVAGQPVTLTATVTSASSQLTQGASASFTQTTRSTVNGITTTATAGIAACTNLTAWGPTVAVGVNRYTAKVTCTTTEAANGTGGFAASFSGGTTTSGSQGNLGQVTALTPTVSYGPNAQTTAGGCAGCYYGETSTPDAEGDAFVNGNLSGELTIGTSNNIVIDGNLTYADCSGRWTTGQSGSAAISQGLCAYQATGKNDSLGLIANAYVEVNHPVATPTGPVLSSCATAPGALCDASNGSTGLTIDAAILALTQSFVVNNYKVGSAEGPLTLYGSIQQNARGPVGTFSGSSLTSGYQKHYTWDPHLDFTSPPSYLVPSTAPWVLTAVHSDAGQQTTNTCPALPGIWSGDSTHPNAPITRYCAGGAGGLPGYPSITVPSPPTNVGATASLSGSVTVAWTAAVDNGSPVTGYTVTSSPSGGGCAAGPTATTCTVTGLSPGTSYVFAVVATNAKGASDPSMSSAAITVPAPPFAPAQVSAVPNPDGTIGVSWTAPSANGTPIVRSTVTPTPACSTCTGTVVMLRDTTTQKSDAVGSSVMAREMA